jgi:hypothetical protein
MLKKLAELPHESQLRGAIFASCQREVLSSEDTAEKSMHKDEEKILMHMRNSFLTK